MKKKKMVNYQMGKIYKITSFQTDLVYIGSTTKNYLCDRMSRHRYDFKNDVDCTSKEIIKYGDAKIELIKLFPCNSKDELEAEEANYIRTLNCVNKKIPGKISSDYYKEYRKKNKLIISEKAKLYYQANKNKELK